MDLLRLDGGQGADRDVLRDARLRYERGSARTKGMGGL